ncbi:MAG: amidohydrolase family protein [Acidobacteria bacterium]|nr:amidohydrolase family protein [Acidobacteriota bacterium]
MRPLVLALLTAALAPAATLIQNATLVTVSHGTLEKASLLIEGGKIAALGPDVTAPAGATVIDASDHYVLPGIVDCHSHLAADSINESSVAVSSMVSMEDVLNPEDISIYRALAGGVTTANILHGSANPIGGRCTVIKMRWGRDAERLLFQGAKPGIKFALGENPKRGSKPVHPGSRQGVNDVIREAFLRAKAYQAAWKDYDAARQAGRRALPPRRDLQLEALAEVLEGKRLVHAHCYRADEILALIRLADEIGFKIRTLQHVLEGYKVADEIAAHGAGASTFSDWWGYKVEAYDAIPYNAALMTRRGILVSINSDSDEEIRHLNQEAAKTIKWGGLSEDEALALVTLNPAKQLMIDDRVGSLDVGKDADLAIWDGPPLSVYSKVLTTFVDGEIFFDRELDRQRRIELTLEKQKLLEELEGKKPSAEKEPAR